MKKGNNIQGSFSYSKMALTTSGFVIALLVVLVVGSQSPFGIPAAAENFDTVQAVEAATVEYQEHYMYRRDFIGQVEASQTSEAGFEIGGMIRSLLVDEGDVVAAGQVLAQLDTARLQARRSEAEAELARANADARLAARTYKRFSQARQANAVSAQDKDEAREQRDITAASEKVAQARLDSINVDIDKSELIAPFAGTIIQRMKDEGAVVSSGETVLEIQQNAEPKVRVGLSSEAADKLFIGQKKTVSAAGEEYHATVTSILPIRGRTRTIDVIASLDRGISNLRPGDVVRFPVELKIVQRGFHLPLTALVEGERGLWSVFVLVEKDGAMEAERRTIEIHYVDSSWAFASGAINDGESVIAKGASKIVPGQKIRIAGMSHEQ